MDMTAAFHASPDAPVQYDGRGAVMEAGDYIVQGANADDADWGCVQDDGTVYWTFGEVCTDLHVTAGDNTEIYGAAMRAVAEEDAIARSIPLGPSGRF